MFVKFLLWFVLYWGFGGEAPDKKKVVKFGA
jgi:hypothetical protein